MRFTDRLSLALGFLLLAAPIMMTGCGDSSVNASRSSDPATTLTGPFGGPSGENDFSPGSVAASAVLLVIDEESIDNGNEPNGFSDVDVNDNKAELGVRDQLHFFENNIGNEITLNTGDVGDEGWYALKSIPSSWTQAGPTDQGAWNFALAGPGLGSPNDDDDREALLDKIRNVTPLRAQGLAELVGQTVLAVVYDSDVSINFSPLNGSLKGANLGVVALRVTDIRQRFDGSTGSLPQLTVEILDANEFLGGELLLFSSAPVPESSSEPYDVAPPSLVNPPVLVPAP